jgi:hypothetical protein
MGLLGDLRCRRRCRMGVPADTDEITQEWLTAALHQAGALDQARVTSIQPAPIGQLGFTGQIRQLQISYDKPEPCAPRTLVGKFSTTHPEARAAVHSMGFYEREIGFYRELAADCPVRTPRCYVPGPDLAGFLVGYLDTSERRRHENRLLEMYYSVLIQHGITGYSFEQCWDDYRMALVLPTSHVAIAVGYHPGLTSTPDGDWNVVFPRYAQALADLGVAELLQQRYG